MMFKNLLNQFQFHLRSGLLGKMVLRPGPPQTLSREERGKELQFYRLLLSRAFARDNATGEMSVKEVKEVVDIGCRNGSYLDALGDFFPNARITGVEVDGGRRYWNLYRRIDQAQAYVRLLEETGKAARVFGMDFRELPITQVPQQTVFTFFFPFVSKDPCLGWGLPVKYSDFSGLLEHSLKLMGSVPESGIWLSAHQGDWEAEIARKIYLSLDFKIFETWVSAEETAQLWPSPYPTRILLATKAKAGHETLTLPKPKGPIGQD